MPFTLPTQCRTSETKGRDDRFTSLLRTWHLTVVDPSSDGDGGLSVHWNPLNESRSQR